MALAEREFARHAAVPHLPARAISRVVAVPAFARLAALCVGLVGVETFVLLHLDAGSALALAPQIAAPAPWGAFHDDRWLLAYAGSWPALVLGAIVLVAVRGVLTAAMVKAAWPRNAEPLPWRKALTRGCSSTVVAALLLSPCASLLVAFSLAPISDLWLAAIPAALGIAIFVHHGPVDCWWLRHPRLRSVGWVLLSYIELTVAGAVIVMAPRGWVPVIAAVAGLADAWMWRGFVHALARPARLRLAPVSPLGLAGVVGVTVLAVTAAATPPSSASGAPPAHHPAAAAAAAPDHPKHHVLLVSGYGVHWNGNAPSLGPGFSAREFSYRGVTPQGKPLAYTGSSTQQPLPVLLDKFRVQVRLLALQSGHNIDIVGESEGALLATIYLLTTPNPPVDHVVLLSPLVRPARGSYPAPGHDGPGLGAGWELRGIANATNSLTPLHVSADSPFIESLGTHADALNQVFGCPVAGVQQFAVLPLADAVGVPPHTLNTVPHKTVTALHGTLLANPGVRYDVARYLLGAAAPGTGHDTVEKLAIAASSAWQAPPLRLHTEPPADVGCAQATAALRSWLG
jgi:hypothetical protein